MRVKCIKQYNDLQLNKLINVGDELEVADARGKILVNAEVAEQIEEPEVKKAPKRVKKGDK